MPLQATSGAASYDAFGAPAARPAYIEDVFSTWLYTGNGSTQTITNAVNLAGKGGLVWIKSRSAATSNFLFDTARGALNELNSDTDQNELLLSNSLTAFNATGFSIGSATGINVNAATYTSWAFRKQPKFFDVVTYTGNNTNRTIPHNLGSVPGCIIVKRSSGVDDWQVYHRNNSDTQYMVLNTTATLATGTTRWNSTAPTDAVFSIGTDASVNALANTYVAYLFAHDAGGFGLSGAENVITCASYIGNGSASGPTVTLGYEPQWLMVKNASGTGSWQLIDNMRGMFVGSADSTLQANSSSAESSVEYIAPTAKGFQVVSTSSEVNSSGLTYIYVAIRRGPMKVPATGTSVLGLNARAGTGVNATVTGGSGVTDLAIIKNRGSSTNFVWASRLLSTSYLSSNATTAGTAAGTTILQANPWDVMDGVKVGTTSSLTNASGSTFINYLVDRAPGFFDVVCYTGTGSATTVEHNLAAVPQLMLVKSRSGVANWQVYSGDIANTEYLVLNTTAARATGLTRWNSTTPTASVFSLGTDTTVNGSGSTYVAYLFTTCLRVSKVSVYAGTGAAQTINCGFGASARFVMIKRVDSTGDWYIWDTARGIISGNDPYLLLNSTAADVTGTDYIAPQSSGFGLTASAPAALNAVSGVTWTTRTSGTGETIYGIGYGNGLFVAVGDVGALTTSPDGVTWTSRTSSFGTDIINAVTYGAGVFVAVGTSGKLATSTDGITWTQRTSSFSSSIIRAVTYGGGLFVAAGSDGKLATSTDGITWTQQTSSFGATIIYGVTYGGGLFVAVGEGGKLATSPNGTTWTQKTSSFGTDDIYGVTYGNGVFVAVGNTGKLATSPDGTTWTQQTSSFGTSSISAIAYGTGLFVAVSSAGDKIATSADGITWTQQTIGGVLYGPNAVAYGGGIGVVGGFFGSMVTSPISGYIFLAIA